ncbi:MAG: peptide chain release factor N(5)-glutamine methyltransferase [Candidatus Omnitrophica bacterium]|nr:peptide chain release factor N(5)-glutamine methyltransferase [Candidatus Omnitrophota bacterium]
MREAELLFTDCLDCSRSSLYSEPDTALTKEQAQRIALALRRRIAGEPIHYILGAVEFFGLRFKVTPDVLIPRPETEILVESALRFAPHISCRASGYNVLDIGTGSGCIAIALAKHLPFASICACDISEPALKIACENASAHGVERQIDFVHHDCQALRLPLAAPYDMIVSNPPYIPSDTIATLQIEVRQEPRIALDGGKDGLDFYRAILKRAPLLLKRDGFLIMEIGCGQASGVSELIAQQESLRLCEIVKDYNQIDRIMVVKHG